MCKNETNKKIKYRVSVVIKNISVEEYMSQYEGNEETPIIMSKYETMLIGEMFHVFDAEYYQFFDNLKDAQDEFALHETYHSCENGDAMNIAETRSTISRDTEYKQTIMYCKDGHDITITLEEVQE